jgi:hypothetical protein
MVYCTAQPPKQKRLYLIKVGDRPARRWQEARQWLSVLAIFSFCFVVIVLVAVNEERPGVTNGGDRRWYEVM